MWLEKWQIRIARSRWPLTGMTMPKLLNIYVLGCFYLQPESKSKGVYTHVEDFDSKL